MASRLGARLSAVGREVLEELPTLWDPENPALQMIKTVDARP